MCAIKFATVAAAFLSAQRGLTVSTSCHNNGVLLFHVNYYFFIFWVFSTVHLARSVLWFSLRIKWEIMQMRFISTKASILNTCMCVCAYYVKVTINSNLAAKKYITHFACALALATRVTHDRQGGIHAYTYVVSQLLSLRISWYVAQHVAYQHFHIAASHDQCFSFTFWSLSSWTWSLYSPKKKYKKKKWKKKNFEKKNK